MTTSTPVPTILIVDDDPEIQRFFEQAFQDYPEYRLILASDGAHGLERVTEVLPAVAIIDLNMPKLGGYQLVQALRGDPDTAAIPLIILSARTQAKDKRMADLLGADLYLEKPVVISEVIAAIQRVLRINSSERARHMRQIADDQPSGQEY